MGSGHVDVSENMCVSESTDPSERGFLPLSQPPDQTQPRASAAPWLFYSAQNMKVSYRLENTTAGAEQTASGMEVKIRKGSHVEKVDVPRQ